MSSNGEALLKLMRSSPGEYVSGETISRQLQCSRTAVWKLIRKLKEQGYRFEATSRLGYKLLDEPDQLDLESVASMLNTKRFGRHIHGYDSIDSTQIAAHQWVALGKPEGTVIVAEEQTKGRGRMGRSWHSPKGKGLWFSLILKPPVPLPQLPQLTLLTAAAVCRVMRKQLPGVEVGIKWPNDLLIDGRKVCGILLESAAEDERLSYVAAGIGISVNLDPEDYPEKLHSIAVSMKMANGGKAIPREPLLASILNELEMLYDLYLEEGFAPIKSLWEALSSMLDKPVKLHTGRGVLEGIARSLDTSGGLLVEYRNPDGSLQSTTVYSGELVQLP